MIRIDMLSFNVSDMHLQRNKAKDLRTKGHVLKIDGRRKYSEVHNDIRYRNIRMTLTVIPPFVFSCPFDLCTSN